MERLRLENVLRSKSDAEVGRLVKEYFLEGNHNSWDGWQGIGYRRARGVLALITDLRLYLEHAL